MDTFSNINILGTYHGKNYVKNRVSNLISTEPYYSEQRFIIVIIIIQMLRKI